MTTIDVTMVRIYLREEDAELESMLDYLHDQERVRGVTAFRGIAGFGTTGNMDASSMLDMSMDLPIVIEFFEKPDKAAAVIEHLSESIDPGHIVQWPAKMNG